ncbi:MAG TPA: hypothetical protein DCY88_18315 [Cyanobacteria bacterium UBA11372]|nr:hypothetical protein [Cyanobacteria bacterium UBA11372]
MKSRMILIAALNAIRLSGQPSLAAKRVTITTLNARLLGAVCAQNWHSTIRIVELTMVYRRGNSL